MSLQRINMLFMEGYRAAIRMLIESAEGMAKDKNAKVVAPLACLPGPRKDYSVQRTAGNKGEIPMKTKLIMTVALLATFANAQFFTNALASQLKQEQKQTTDTARTDNAEPQAVTIDFENDHAELVNICRETWYRIHRRYTRPSRLQVRVLTERYAGETNAPHCMNMYGIYSGEWGTSADKVKK